MPHSARNNSHNNRNKKESITGTAFRVDSFPSPMTSAGSSADCSPSGFRSPPEPRYYFGHMSDQDVGHIPVLSDAAMRNSGHMTMTVEPQLKKLKKGEEVDGDGVVADMASSSSHALLDLDITVSNTNIDMGTSSDNSSSADELHPGRSEGTLLPPLHREVQWMKPANDCDLDRGCEINEGERGPMYATRMKKNTVPGPFLRPGLAAEDAEEQFPRIESQPRDIPSNSGGSKGNSPLDTSTTSTSLNSLAAVASTASLDTTTSTSLPSSSVCPLLPSPSAPTVVSRPVSRWRPYDYETKQLVHEGEP